VSDRGRLDRLGDWSVKVSRSLLANPALTIGGVTVTVFAVARVPTEIFYLHFGVRPEEAGFNSVQVLLQGSSMVLIASLVIGTLYGILMPFLILIRPTRWRVRTPKGKTRVPGWEEYGTAARRSLRAAPAIVPAVTLLTAIVLLSVGAFKDAAAIQDGRAPTTKLMPWRAVPVNVIWATGTQQASLPNCLSLFYLGEGGGRVTLYDSRDQRTYRLDSGDVQLDFPDSCRPS